VTGQSETDLPAKKRQTILKWWDNAANCLTRQLEDGCIEKATMEEGSAGFAVAIWPSGEKEETEKTNLDVFLLSSQLCVGGPQKKPACDRRALGEQAIKESDKPDAGQPVTGKPVTGKLGTSKHGTSKTGAIKVMPSNSAWEKTPSFGLVKMTLATDKSYIQAKPDWGSKPWCLVNVTGKPNRDHKVVCRQLLDFVKSTPDLTKEAVVSERNRLTAS